MPSIKLKSDTLAVLGALRGRFGAGHSYDALIHELVQRYNASLTDTITAGDRLKRVEEMLVQLTLRLDEKEEQASRSAFKIE